MNTNSTSKVPQTDSKGNRLCFYLGVYVSRDGKEVYKLENGQETQIDILPAQGKWHSSYVEIDGVAAGIGNLVAEGEKENILKVFWEMNTIRHFVAGFICYSVYLLIHPFISLWLGPEYILDNTILIILLVYTYITISRGVIDMFNHAYGLYADVWSAWTELILNISITFTIGYYYGIIGIVVGKLFSVFRLLQPK